MKIKLALLGASISKSLSPIIHKKILKSIGIDVDYYLFDVAFENLGKAIGEIKNSDILGINVTMPYKKEVIKFLDEAHGASINTIKNKNNKLIGFSTDGLGFLRSLDLPIDNKNIVIIGLGGSAEAIICEIKNFTKNITIISRSKKHEEFPTKTFEKLPQACNNCDILINATPLGITSDFKNFDFLNNLPKSALVYDLNYIKETNLLKRAKSLGLGTQNGIKMLIMQAVYSDEIFLDRKINIDFNHFSG
jgi:shikimate dehydrogenase